MPRHAARRTRPVPFPAGAVVVLAGALVVVLAAAALASWRPGAGGGGTTARQSSVSAATATAAVAAPAAEPASPTTASGPGRWRRVLGRLDDRRTRALRDANPSALAAVYAPGSAVLARDRATLGAYQRRGLRLRGAELALLEVRVLGREPGRVRLHVVDRLGGTSAVTPAGRGLPLPRDRATERVVTLVRTAAGWRVASVTA